MRSKFFMELKFSTRYVSVKMYAHQVRIETGRYQKLDDKVESVYFVIQEKIESEMRKCDIVCY